MYKRCKTFQFILQRFYNVNIKHYKHIKNKKHSPKIQQFMKDVRKSNNIICIKKLKRKSIQLCQQIIINRY